MEKIDSNKEEFTKSLKTVFENFSYESMLKEEDATIDYIYTTPENGVYKVSYEPEEKEFHVSDKDGKELDIFDDQTVDIDGNIPKALRRAISDDFMKNHSKAEAVAETAVATPPATIVEKDKWIQKAVNPDHVGKFTTYCKHAGFSGPNSDCIAHARASGDKSVEGMANFANNVKK